MARWETEKDGLGKQGGALCLIVEKGTNEDRIVAGGLPAPTAEALVATHNRDKGASVEDRWYTLMGQVLQGVVSNPERERDGCTIQDEIRLAAKAADLAMEYADHRDPRALDKI